MRGKAAVLNDISQREKYREKKRQLKIEERNPKRSLEWSDKLKENQECSHRGQKRKRSINLIDCMLEIKQNKFTGRIYRYL